MVTSEAPPRVRAVRIDALPEYQVYRDDGCSVAPSCLACPLERCRYDEPQGLKSARARERAAQISEMRCAGASIAEIISTLGVSRRTVTRAAQGAS